MESLALLATILVSITLFSAPISLIISSRKAQLLTSNLVLTILRRIIFVLVVAVGAINSLFFIIGPVPLMLKFISLIAIIILIWSILREFGREFISRLKDLFGKSP